LAKKVADVIIESLIAAGVKRVYGISGDSLNGITDSIREHDKDISWVHIRHEESAAFAAERKLTLQDILLSVQEAAVQEIHT
jgi:pyruvate dehydrogenase (quinone)